VTRFVSQLEIEAAQRLGSYARAAGEPYLHVRALEDGRFLFLLQWRAHGVQLSVGAGDGVFTDTWIFDAEQYDAGWREARGWDGQGEPNGWYRHVQSGRRREGGDPAKEYIQR
jgi:hypothetical protein